MRGPLREQGTPSLPRRRCSRPVVTPPIETGGRREEQMDRTEAAELASGDAETGKIVHRVTAELGEIAAEVARVSEASSPNMELLEASRAIQSALVSLSNWNGSDDKRVEMSGAARLTLRDAWIAFGPHESWDRVRPTPLDV